MSGDAVRLYRSGAVVRTDTQTVIGTISPSATRFGDWPQFRQFRAKTLGGADLGMFPNPGDAASALWHAVTVERLE